MTQDLTPEPMTFKFVARYTLYTVATEIHIVATDWTEALQKAISTSRPAGAYKLQSLTRED